MKITKAQVEKVDKKEYLMIGFIDEDKKQNVEYMINFRDDKGIMYAESRRLLDYANELKISGKLTKEQELEFVSRLEKMNDLVATISTKPIKSNKAVKYALAFVGIFVGGACVGVGVESCQGKQQAEADTAIETISNAKTTENVKTVGNNDGYTVSVEDAIEDEVVARVTNAVTVMDAYDTEVIAYNAAKYLNDELKLNISQESINATTYAFNQEYITEEATKELIDAGFIKADYEDVYVDTLQTRDSINNNNSMSSEDKEGKIEIISYSIFCGNERDKKLADEFAEALKENKKIRPELRRLSDKLAEVKPDEKKYAETLKEYEETAKPIVANWNRFMVYGGLKDESELGDVKPFSFDMHQSSIAGAWIAMQQLQPFSVYAGIAGVPSEEIEFASNVNKGENKVEFYNEIIDGKPVGGEQVDVSTRDSRVFLDVSTQINALRKNLGEACETKTR